MTMPVYLSLVEWCVVVAFFNVDLIFIGLAIILLIVVVTGYFIDGSIISYSLYGPMFLIFSSLCSTFLSF